MNNDNHFEDAATFLSLIRSIVQEQLTGMDSTTVCIVERVNNDGTLNIYIPPDMNNFITGVINASKFSFRRGDAAILYKIQNQLSNSFIIMRVGGDRGGGN